MLSICQLVHNICLECLRIFYNIENKFPPYTDVLTSHLLMISPLNGKLWPLRALCESESDRKIIKKANNKSPRRHGLQSFFAGLCKLTISQPIIAKVDILWASPPTWQRLQSTGRDTPSFSTYCKAVRSQVWIRRNRTKKT